MKEQLGEYKLFMIVIFIIILIMTLLPIIAEAKHPHPESYYQKIDCTLKGGIAEYRLPNKRRIDCLTKEEAIEHDWQKKLFECLGQALYYGYATKRKAVCALIVKEKNSKEYKLLKELEKKPLKLDRVYEIIE